MEQNNNLETEEKNEPTDSSEYSTAETEDQDESVVQENHPAHKRRRKGSDTIRHVIACAIFIAIAFAVEFVFHIKVNFLTFDAKDAILSIGAMALGPISGLVMSLALSLLELITISDTGLWGFLMNFVSTGVFVVVSGLIYRKWRNLVGAGVGLLCSVVSMTGVMMAMNLLVTPIYMGVDRSTVAGMIPSLLLPFNLLKALLNASLVLILYKPSVTALRASGLIRSDGDGKKFKFGKRSVLVLILGILLAAASICLMIFVMKGSFSWT